MKPLSYLILAACGATILLAPAAQAKEPMDPSALAALQRMSTTLASAKAFTFQTRSVLEVPASTGQFLTLFSTARVAVQRPNKISAHLGGEAPAFDFFYDGATVSAFAPATKVYSTTKAPSTIDAMLPDLERETGIRFPTAPLFFSNPYRVLTRNLISALDVGPALVNGADCEHLAFRSPGVNWEIWIEAGPRALPLRMAVTFTDRTNFPRTLIEFSHWNLSPWLFASRFVFQPPAGTREIPFQSVLHSAGR